MTELVEWLRAQLDEDERTIRAAGGEGIIAWLTYHDDQGQMRYTTVASGHGTAADPGDVWVATGKELPAPASVLVVHDSARALAEIEAKRRMVDLHGHAVLRAGGGAKYYDTTTVCRSCEPNRQFPEESWPCATLRLLALPYADRPGYQERWRP